MRTGEPLRPPVGPRHFPCCCLSANCPLQPTPLNKGQPLPHAGTPWLSQPPGAARDLTTWPCLCGEVFLAPLHPCSGAQTPCLLQPPWGPYRGPGEETVPKGTLILHPQPVSPPHRLPLRRQNPCSSTGSDTNLGTSAHIPPLTPAPDTRAGAFRSRVS